MNSSTKQVQTMKLEKDPSKFDQNIQLPRSLSEIENATTKILNAMEKEIAQKSLLQPIPEFWNNNSIDQIYIPVKDGEIRVFHHTPTNPISKRPLVYVPGWGGIPKMYQDLYEVLHYRVEFYYVETREKESSHMNRWKAQFTMSQKAEDIGVAIKELGLKNQDYILFGACWGGAMVLQGVMDGTLNAPTTVTLDPMHTLWYPKWILRWIAPILPPVIFNILKPLLRWMQMHKMHEKRQKERANGMIDRAVMWKWRKTAIQVRDFELFGNVNKISQEIFVVNATNDKIHQESDYPKIALEMPKGRFIRLKTGEERRERLMGIIAREFTSVTKDEGLPAILKDFEVNLPRNM